MYFVHPFIFRQDGPSRGHTTTPSDLGSDLAHMLKYPISDRLIRLRTYSFGSMQSECLWIWQIRTRNNSCFARSANQTHQHLSFEAHSLCQISSWLMFCAVSLLYQWDEHARSLAALLRAMARTVDRGLQTGAVE